MTRERQVLAAGAVLSAIAIFGIKLALSEKSPRHPHVDGMPEDSASALMRGTDWNGPIGLPSSDNAPSDPAPATATANDPGMPGSGVVPPPLTAIPQPTIAPPIDDTMAAGQRARAVQMIQNRLISLKKEAADEEQRGSTDEAAATRIRIERLTARLAQLQDGGAP